MMASQRRLKQRLVESTRDMIECAAAMRSHGGDDGGDGASGHGRAHGRADAEGDDDGLDASAASDAGDGRVYVRGGRRGDVSVTSSPDSRAQTQTPNAAADTGCVVRLLWSGSLAVAVVCNHILSITDIVWKTFIHTHTHTHTHTHCIHACNHGEFVPLNPRRFP